MKSPKIKKIIAYGYIKKEDGIYTAICVNMGLFGQGETPEEALENVIQATESYIDYVLEKHPEDFERHFNRPAPYSFVNEFKRGLANIQKLVESKSSVPRQSRMFFPVTNFAQEISLAEAQ